MALSDQRPGSFDLVDDARVDVVTRGDYIPAGAPIEVVADEGYRRVVRRRAQQAQDDGTPALGLPGVREGAEGKG